MLNCRKRCLATWQIVFGRVVHAVDNSVCTVPVERAERRCRRRSNLTYPSQSCSNMPTGPFAFRGPLACATTEARRSERREATKRGFPLGPFFCSRPGVKADLQFCFGTAILSVRKRHTQ